MNLDEILENKFFQKTFEILKDNYLTIGVCEPFSKGNLSKTFEKLDPNGICFNGQYKGFWYKKTPEIIDEDR
ncbi:hypothetical protein JIY74_33915 [Vibrio harveyi]|nr:hypothetical protein [Vibrio harveyi]